MSNANLLPHSNRIRGDVESYLKEALEVAGESTGGLSASSEFRAIYKTALATDCVLEKLSDGVEVPRLDAARGLVRRYPILIAFGQLSPSANELRRFVEVALWCVYFTDHPVEWKAFSENPSRGFARDLAQPIAYCAFRELGFYQNYVSELMADEPSELAKAAATELGAIVGNLNRQIHAAHVAAAESLNPAWDEPSGSVLKDSAKVFRDVCKNTCILLAAFFRDRFNHLPPVEREWFNWLVGRDVTKQVRAGPFGLQR